MRIAPILVALIVVLGWCREAGAAEYILEFGNQRYGIADFPIHQRRTTVVWIDPRGPYEVPFTVTQGLVGFCVIAAMLVILPVVLTLRWRKKRTTA